jgi:hypothetical protein
MRFIVTLLLLVLVTPARANLNARDFGNVFATNRYNQTSSEAAVLASVLIFRLERELHGTLPLGPEEGQKFYIQKQMEKGLLPPWEYPHPP